MNLKPRKDILRRNLTLVIAAAAPAMVEPVMAEGADQKLTVSHEGWTLAAEPTEGVLAIGHTGLDSLLANVGLKIQTPERLSPAKAWTIGRGDDGRLVIKTAEPQSTWLFEMGNLALKISCTAPYAVLTAQVPVGKHRVVARLLDREGVPVEWTGTDEVVGSYGGNMTRNPSHLPRQNPECMYFALGRVSGGVFHSLFDRATDTAIQFPDQAQLLNGKGDQDSLELTLPFSGSVQIRLTPEYYTKTLGVPFYVPFDEGQFPRPPMVWCSWTSYYGTPALDSTNPEVLDFLRKLFTTLAQWGFEYYKFDGEHALPKYVPAVNRDQLYEKAVGTPLNGIGFFNSYFNGQDAYNNWHGMHALFSSINANAFLNRMLVYVMPGEGMELGERTSVEEAKRRRPAEVVDTARTREDPMIGFGVTTAEARTLVSLVALSGVAYPLAGVMPELPAERLALLQRTLPTMPIQPADLFSRGTDLDWDTFKHIRPDDYIHHYPEILDLKVNAGSGQYDVVALPNWRSAPVRKSLSLTDKLGLDAGAKYIAFDFWNQRLLGVFQDRLSVEVEGHDTRVVLVHAWLNHPQLIGTSRHITGAYSIQHLVWDASRRALSGVSETVPGQEYALFVYAPDDSGLSKVQATAKGAGKVPFQRRQTGNLLSVSFQGRPQAVQWQIDFGPELSR